MAKVRVRIVVAVDPTGAWNSFGAAKVDDDDAMMNAVEHVAEGEARYWVTAELDLPERLTLEVPGNVETGSQTSGEEQVCLKHGNEPSRATIGATSGCPSTGGDWAAHVGASARVGHRVLQSLSAGCCHFMERDGVHA